MRSHSTLLRLGLLWVAGFGATPAAYALDCASITCNDNNPCTTDTCDAVVGCRYVVDDSAACSDNNLCTTGDHCSAGACIAGGALACPDDANPCTTAACSTVFGCYQANNTAVCSDGNACTLNDQCSGGVCRAGAAKSCGDGNACTDDLCDPASGACLNAPNAAACSDGDVCTVQDQCADGACLPGTPRACNDNNPCTRDTCAPGVGCVYEADDSAVCSDNSVCTTGDHCSAGACVAGGALACPDDGNVCTSSTCNPVTGCGFTFNTLPCDDANGCTVNDQCGGGVCQPGTPKSCGDGNTCTDDACDPATGSCVYADNAVPCSDNNPCTRSDRCGAGACLPGEALGCDDADPCTADACDPVVGCTHVALDDVPCDDEDPCSVGDTCQAGLCVSTPAACPAYAWATTAYGECSAQCGGGTQLRGVFCTLVPEGTVVPELFCDAATKPEGTQACNAQPCVTYAWSVGDFGACSAECGGGVRVRTVACVSSIGQTVEHGLCPQPGPAASEACNGEACVTYGWVAGALSACSVACGEGVSTRTVTCVGSDASVDPTGAQCDAAARPADTVPCLQPPCETWAWETGEWGPCSARCGEGVATRTATCASNLGNHDGTGLACGAAPARETACEDHVCAPYQAATVLPGVGAWTGAFGINNAGLVAGLRAAAGGQPQAVLWPAPDAMPFALLPGAAPGAVALAVNNADPAEVAGFVILANRTLRPARWSDTALAPRLLVNAGALHGLNDPLTGAAPNAVGGLSTGAAAFSVPPRDDRVVAFAAVAGATRPVAYGLNDLGQAVGGDLGEGGAGAWLWEPTGPTTWGAPVALPTGGFARTVATGINNAGEIVGTGEDAAGRVVHLFWPAPNVDGRPAPLVLPTGDLSPYGVHFGATGGVGINDFGEAVGAALDATGALVPVYYAPLPTEGPFAWAPGPWGRCSAACDGGERVRTVLCRGQNGVAVDAALCADAPMPAESEACNVSPCCPDGTRTVHSGTAVSCVRCAAGTYATAGAVACTPCAAGSVAAVAGSAACGLCPAGTYARADGRACVTCGRGSYSAEGATACTRCTPGSFASTTGARACTPCSPGAFAAAEGASSCTLCPAGTVQDDAGAVACDACPAGTAVALRGQTACAPCVPGYYAPSDGLARCLSCNPGTAQALPGATSCDLCAPGEYTSARAALTCKDCPRGTAAADAGSATCAKCALGSYQDDLGQIACDLCPEGRTTLRVGSTTPNACVVP